MPVLKLVPLNDPMLRRRTRGVPRILVEHRHLISDMIDTIVATEGIGLSANQVGSRHRIAVIYLPTWTAPVVLINPRLLRREGKYETFEGCLSIPGYKGKTERFERVIVRALALDGVSFNLDAKGVLAHVIQHEVDHLDGKLYIERLVKPENESKNKEKPDGASNRLWRP